MSTEEIKEQRELLFQQLKQKRQEREALNVNIRLTAYKLDQLEKQKRAADREERILMDQLFKLGDQLRNKTNSQTLKQKQ